MHIQESWGPSVPLLAPLLRDALRHSGTVDWVNKELKTLQARLGAYILQLRNEFVFILMFYCIFMVSKVNQEIMLRQLTILGIVS